MTCREFRELFVRLLREEPPAGFPVEAYRRHFVSCQPCRLLLSLREVGDTLTDYAGGNPPRRPSLRTEEVLRRARRRAVFRTVMRRTGVASLLLLLAATGFLLLRGGTGEPPSGTPPVAEPPAPMSADEFAAGFADGQFTPVRTISPGFEGMVVLIFERADPSADQYSFVKRLALSDFPERFPDAPKLLVTVTEEKGEKESLLQVLMTREELLANRGKEFATEPATRFLRRFLVTYDKEKGTEHKGE